MNALISQLEQLGFEKAAQMWIDSTSATDPQLGPPYSRLLTDAEEHKDIYYHVFASSHEDTWQIDKMYVSAQLETVRTREGVVVVQQSFPDSTPWPSKSEMLLAINKLISREQLKEAEAKEEKRQAFINSSITFSNFKKSR